MDVEDERGMKMTKNAVVFSGRNGLDFNDLRMGALRIPEVSLRLREAQAILDQNGIEIDLLNVITSDDEYFFRNIKLKSLMAAVVQVGLFDRYLKATPMVIRPCVFVQVKCRSKTSLKTHRRLALSDLRPKR
jgi:hypothetical protein